MGSYSLENDTKINPNLQQVQEPTNEISESVSKASKMRSDESFQKQQYNLPSNIEKGLHGSNFTTLGKISLKKYYETTDPYSLFQLKGYNIKYETIRRTKLYQSLKG